MKQIIIIRKDLGMSQGKMCAQAAHASMAFLTNIIRNNSCLYKNETIDYKSYRCQIDFRSDIFEDWIDGEFTKIVCGAKNKNQLMKAVMIAEELGLKENKRFWLIKDNCHTELEPDEYDENGVGRCLTCIGFIPLQDDIAEKISKKFQLLK